MKITIIFNKNSNESLECSQELLKILNSVSIIDVKLLGVDNTTNLQQESSDLFIFLQDNELGDMENIDYNNTFIVLTSIGLRNASLAPSIFQAYGKDNIENQLFRFLGKKIFSENKLNILLKPNCNDKDCQTLAEIYKKAIIQDPHLQSFIEVNNCCCDNDTIFVSFEKEGDSTHLTNEYEKIGGNEKNIPIVIVSNEKWRFPYIKDSVVLNSQSVKGNIKEILRESLRENLTL